MELELILLKIEAIQSWPRPMYPTNIRSFLGLARYNRRFVEDFLFISYALKMLTPKIANFQWSKSCEKNLQELKKLLTTTLILTLPEGTHGFVLYCNVYRVSSGYE